MAQHITDKLIERATDPKVVQQITDAWGGYIDRALGRGLRRVGLYVVVGLLGVGAVKLDLLAKFFKP